MNALARTDYAPWSLSEAVVSDLVRKGLHLFDAPLDARRCAELLEEIRGGRRLDETLFRPEPEADAPLQAASSGLLDRLEPKLAFVERAPQVVEALWSLLGPDYRTVERKVVCVLPDRLLPAWLQRRVRGGAAGDLSGSLRPEHQDLVVTTQETFHQDAAGSAEVLTLDLRLTDTVDGDGALRLLEGSHRMGACATPHDLKATSPGLWRYRCGALGEMYVAERVLAGDAGALALHHAFTLTAWDRPTDQPQVLLRYRFARGEAKSAGVDEVNASLAGPLSLG